MGNYRDRIGIIADILSVTKQGAKKTQIMYQANLSYQLLAKYLLEAKQACLIRQLPKEKNYIPTRKGLEFLERYREYLRHQKYVEKQIKASNGKRKLLEKLCSI